MNRPTACFSGGIVLLASCFAVAALGDDRLPRDSKPLEAIVESLESSGYVVVDADIDHGHWEIDAYKDNEPYELHIDPVTGKTLFTYRDDADPAPPAGAMKLSKLLKAVSAGGYSPILSAEFKHGRWEVEARKDGQKRELEVDAASGKIVSDRVDD
ncbi:MAG: PepSY domain-containing protein [Pirellulales bacterium]|nr:PepSY domain-containing protein [Pirellulales bacterium]